MPLPSQRALALSPETISLGERAQRAVTGSQVLCAQVAETLAECRESQERAGLTAARLECLWRAYLASMCQN